MGFWKRMKELRKVKPVPEEERIKLEKSDYPAMILAAFLTIVLPCVLILGLIVFLMMLLFGLF